MTTALRGSISEMNRLRDKAYAEARRLRAQAIDDFWRGADHLMRSAVQRAERAARRLAARMRRRDAALRGTEAAQELR
ncbi:MAG: hypothetical protein ABL900_01725 [Burkholderiaceae bacterium]